MTCTSPFQSLADTMIPDGSYDDAFYDYGVDEKPHFKMEIDPPEEEKTYYNLDETSQSGSTNLGGVVSQSNIMGILEAGENDLLSWQNRHPEHWGTKEVLDYVYYLVERYQQMVDWNNFCGERFQHIDGVRMCSMTEEDFTRLEPNYGQYIYRTFRNLLEQVKFKEPPMEDTTQSVSAMQSLIHRNNMGHHQHTDLLAPAGGTPFHQHHHHHHHHHHEHQHMHLLNSQSQKQQQQTHVHQLSHIPSQQPAPGIEINGYFYDYEIDYDADLPIHEDLGYGSGSVSSDSDKESTHEELTTISKENEIMMQQIHRYYTPQVRSIHTQPPPNYHMPQQAHLLQSIKEEHKPGKRGRPRKLAKSTDGLTKVRSPTAKGKKPGQVSKGNHLWEFCRDLLKNNQFCPKLIRWEDPKDGVFRIIQSEKVARMWGDKKNNPEMTYEKFSRAMRFCRDQGYFDHVPKNRNFPKKLVFKFGPRAFGWGEEE